MKTYCIYCTKRLSNSAKQNSCLTCRRIHRPLCECGKQRDERAARCQSCSSKLKAREQWANAEITARRVAAMKVAGKQRRVKYEDLTYESFTDMAQDGRVTATYWTEDGRRKRIRRYMWQWIKANGSLPKGMLIHHIDHDKTNDALENLQLMTKAQHARHHGLHKPKLSWLCNQCGKTFVNGLKDGNAPRFYCSQSCHYEYVKRNKNAEKGFHGKCLTARPANDHTKKKLGRFGIEYE